MRKKFKIQLIVFAAFIAFLALIVISSIQPARHVNSSDVRRILDVRYMRFAAERYYHENHVYPPVESGCKSMDLLEGVVSPNFIDEVPQERFASKGHPSYQYAVSPDGEQYVMKITIDKIYPKLDKKYLEADLDGIVLGCDCNDPHYCVASDKSLVSYNDYVKYKKQKEQEKINSEIRKTALETRDISLCQTGTSSEFCRFEYYNNIISEPNECSDIPNLKESLIKECYKHKFILFNEVSQCSNVRYPYIEDCYERIAYRTNDIDICFMISEEKRANECIYEFADRLNDKTACKKFYGDNANLFSEQCINNIKFY